MAKKTSAIAAQMLRKELKEKFPNISFKVKSESYSGGSSINVGCEDIPPHIAQEIEKVLKKYQYGHFDSMNDIYEISNNIESLPQVKYTFLHNYMSESLKGKITDFLNSIQYPIERESVYRVFRGSMNLSDKFWQNV